VTSSDLTFQPHAVRYGPDGALYILGSHEPAIAAGGRSAGLLNAVPYGHVWRVQHKHPRPLNGPKLAVASVAELARALEHPNGWARETALRLLVEEHGLTATPFLTNLLHASRVAPARVAAVWGLQRLGALTTAVWTNAIADYHSAVQKNAWLAYAESQEPVTHDIEKIAEKQLKDVDERVRIAILMALSKGPLTDDGRKSIAKLFPDAKDIWSKSVLLTMGRETPLEFLKVAFASDKSEHFGELAVLLVDQLAQQPGGEERIRNLIAKSDPEKTEKLSKAVKEALGKQRR
jgi:8-oxo-dGTP pyrophosphatase MutT (NUDIX family)